MSHLHEKDNKIKTISYKAVLQKLKKKYDIAGKT